MSEENFRFNSDRVLSIWVIHGGTACLLLLISIISIIENGLPEFKSFLALSVFCALIYGPHTFIFLNHLIFERNTNVILTGSQISIVKQGVKKTFNFDEIVEIKQYEATRTPWTIIVKWKIVSRHDEVMFSSITFPRTKAWRIFRNKLSNETSFFPIFFR